MAMKRTVNIKMFVLAPYLGFDEDEVIHRMEKYWASRGSISSRGDYHLITSYKFEGTMAEIKINVESTEGKVDGLTILCTTDCYKKYMAENIDGFRILVNGFIDYLNDIKTGFYVETFSVRLYPLKVHRLFEYGPIETSNFWCGVSLDNGDFVTLKYDRMEYRTSVFNEETVDNLRTMIDKYT